MEYIPRVAAPRPDTETVDLPDTPYSPSAQKYDTGSAVVAAPGGPAGGGRRSGSPGGLFLVRRCRRAASAGPATGPRPTVTEPPPETERPMVSVPPEDSAIRRAMSRPRPVDPPLERPRSVESALRKPGPSSATTSHAPPAARRL